MKSYADGLLAAAEICDKKEGFNRDMQRKVPDLRVYWEGRANECEEIAIAIRARAQSEQNAATQDVSSEIAPSSLATDAIDQSGSPAVAAPSKERELLRQTFADGMNQIAAMWPCSPGTVERIRNETLDRIDALLAAPVAEQQPVATKCFCGQHDIPAFADKVSWYWQLHGRKQCTLFLPNKRCWCGLLRSEHITGHADSAVASPAAQAERLADEYPWSMETMQMINKLTPGIKGKAFDPDWCLLRGRLEDFERDSLRATAHPQAERLAELEAALEPFAKRADYFDEKLKANGGNWEDEDIYCDDPPSDIYLGQLRAARAALRATPHPAGMAKPKWGPDVHVSTADFIANADEWCQKGKTAKVIIHSDVGEGTIVLYPGTISDYGTDEDAPQAGMVAVSRTVLQSLYEALNSDPPTGPQKSIGVPTRDQTLYHLDGQKMYTAINLVRDLLAAAPDTGENEGEK